MRCRIYILLLLSPAMTESPNLYVEIQVEESAKQRTVIKRNEAPVWNEEFIMYV
jgi:Ca2+-dependent lipid-binding protein